MKNYLRIGCFILLLFTLSVSAVAQENQAMINSSDLLQQIESGEDVFIEGKTIKGKLNLSEGNFPLNEDGLYIIKSEIEFISSDFNNKMDFSNALFEKNVRFRNCKFNDEVQFKDAIFMQIADFRETTYLTDVDFSQVIFENRALFDSTSIHHADFNKTIFKGFANFGNTIFRSGVDFYNVNFTNGSRFQGTTLDGLSEFKNTNFVEDVDFIYLKSNYVLVFNNVTFYGDVIFRGDFLISEVYFIDVNFKGKADFHSASFNVLSFPNTTFSSISLTDTEYNEMYVKWESIKDNLIFNGPAYLKLRNNFNNLEQYEDADDVYYQYRVELRKKQGFLDSVPELFMEVICGYGVKPEKPLFLSVFLIIGFSIHYFGGITNFINSLKKPNENYRNYRKAFIASLGAFLTNSGYENENLKYRHSFAIAVEKVLGWLILTLFIVTLTNVMVRP
jgi:uncharacterized protein YjbI with pentapeptide repeats